MTVGSRLNAIAIVLFSALLVASVLVVSTQAAEFSPESIEAGREIYSQTCVACHGDDGKGAIPGIPDFTEPDRLGSQSQELLLHHIVDGVQSSGSSIPMPPNGGNPTLTDQGAMDVLAYIENAFAR